jgi:hypothetical protein
MEEKKLLFTPASRLQAASDRLLQGGAHYVIDEVAQLPAIIATIGERMARGDGLDAQASLITTETIVS